MAGYRFCRSDDVPALVDAYNACYRVHFPDLPPLTVDGFKRLIRELNLWTSSCMLATDAGETIGVLLAAKREGEANWIHSVGIRPDRQREGHGRHLLTSLSQKLAILGPPRILAELPGPAVAERRFFESCGYREERRFTDLVRAAEPGGGDSSELVIPITVDELIQNDAFDDAATGDWQRAPQTLKNLAERLQGLAIASAERIEAWILFDDEASVPERRLMALSTRDDAAGERMLGLLISACAASTDRLLALRRGTLRETEWLQRCGAGFKAGAETVGHSLEAQPG